ncbi:hypothetical protein M5K25_011427 [Dendrobium thyrsiflorum]|uniref:dihydroneopterin aldolase n=1 Tax=Dendrobium thyrsiflorum TaxID=117978 RepID=A0ABD0V294_DENTH
MEGPSQNLLESVAHLIANTTLLKYPQIHAVRVKVGKPDIVVHGPMDYLGIEILRSRVNNENKATFKVKSVPFEAEADSMSSCPFQLSR